MDEFAMGSSNENSYYGPVKNPIGENLVPGGSSGGSAAAVASEIVPIAFGSETGGSVRQPAAFCGVYGLKPTYGGISRYGLVAFASSMDQIGPLARNIDDLARAYTVVCDRDENDSTSVAFDHPDYSRIIKSERKFTFGIPREYFVEGLEPEIENSIRRAISLLEKNGHRIIDVSLPHSPEAIAIYYIIADAEASSNLARFDGVRFGLREEDSELIKMYCKTRSAGFGKEVKRRIILGTYVLSTGYYDAYYYKAQQVRELLRLDFDKAFEYVDVLNHADFTDGRFQKWGESGRSTGYVPIGHLYGPGQSGRHSGYLNPVWKNHRWPTDRTPDDGASFRRSFVIPGRSRIGETYGVIYAIPQFGKCKDIL